MLLKLFKYDFRNTRKYCIPLLIALAAGTLIACGCFSVMGFSVNFPDPSDDTVTALAIALVLAIFGLLASTFIIIVSFSMFQIMVCVEFYRSLVTDEGYLTFTLPVKAKDIIFSKLLNGIIWTLISIAALFVSIMMIVFTAIATFDTGGGGGAVSTPFTSEDAVILVMMLIYGFVSLISGLLLYFTAIFFASVVAKKNKLIAAIGCVFGANFIYGMVSGMSTFGVDIILSASSPQLYTGSGATLLVLGIMIFFSIGMIFLLFFILKYLMENKLNLA